MPQLRTVEACERGQWSLLAEVVGFGGGRWWRLVEVGGGRWWRSVAEVGRVLRRRLPEVGG